MRKARVIKPKVVKRKVHSKVDLVEHIKKMEAELQGAKQVIEAMQTEIRELTAMHRTQLQIIDNLSNEIRNH